MYEFNLIFDCGHPPNDLPSCNQFAIVRLQTMTKHKLNLEFSFEKPLCKWTDFRELPVNTLMSLKYVGEIT